VTLHVLRALRSDRWDHDTLALLRGAVAATAQPAAVRGSTRYHELPDAGHWVHADNPRGLVQIMLPSLVEAARQ
jgi:pimeloyl-ACP methyl ester carboxylesterase